MYLRDAGQTEVGGFGISQPGDLLLVEDVQLVEQQCTAISVRFDDEAVADFYDRQVDAGRRPEQFSRIWIHTHPGNCPLPSFTDEETFRRCFGGTDWAVMLIIAAGGATYARLQFNVGPQCQRRLQVAVDYTTDFAAKSAAAWDAEYDQHVHALDPFQMPTANRVAPFFHEPPQERESAFSYAEVVEEWYARGDAVDLFSSHDQEEACSRQHVALD